MDAKSRALLEYPQIRARLAAYAAFPPSRRMAEVLEPSDEPLVVARRLDETDEVRELLSERPEIGIGGAKDIGPAVERAARGGRLEPLELLAVAETLVAAGRLGDALRGVSRPLLHDLYREIKPLPSLRLRLEMSIDPAGELLDSASPALGGLRRAVRIAYERLRSRLDQLVHGELGSALQEPIVTLRNGRYVIPVRADAKGKVRGIVHDQSGSGQTLFVEPLIAVELGNAWREAQLKVQAEEERILDELSGLVGAQAVDLRDTLDSLARFDLWAAKARFAAELDAVRAETSKRSEVVLLSARHPGLSGRVVPIDVRLGEDYTAVVITGPNTGGKTVALRTVGLLALMHQSGLHVPAATGSTLPIFRDVFADIGDEQSVAQSLSTFSGHLRSIVRIVEGAGPGCLVLLDELGAGTDPTEGSALAQALLDHFIKAGALVVATTHYAEIKTYAHNTPQARNASVEFDLDTLSPTYRLTIGLPGTSQAFAIAERLGLPPALVADARSRLSRAQQEFESTLASIKASQLEIEAAHARATEAEQRARDARRVAEDERRRARQERETAVAAARVEAEEAVAAVHAEITEARRLLARQTLTERGLDEAMARLEERLAALPTTRPSGERPQAPGTWRVGQRAASLSGWSGTIAALDKDRGRASLEAGGMRVEVPIDELIPPEELPTRPGRAPARGGGVAPGERPVAGRRGDFGAEPPVKVTTARPSVGPRREAGAVRAIPSSLDVRGARVDETIELLEGYLDRAATAGAGRVTIIHGHGSGALRDAVRMVLAKHPLVRDWRPGDKGEGGDGATVVTL
ncbi:MAG: endonuclease MutS2 [Chloroflexota bacterium]